VSRLTADGAANLLLQTAAAGGTAAVALVVSGEGRAPRPGTRLALCHPAAGGQALHGGPLDPVHADFGKAVENLLRTLLARPDAHDGLRHLGYEGGVAEVFVEIRRPVPELVVVGAGHIALPLTRIGAMTGFRVTVLDDRPAFATTERFPDAGRVLRVDFDHPFREVPVHPGSHILLVTRGHKYDYACLVRALRLDPLPGYVGMIGSRRRVRATYARLLEDGIDRALLDRVYAPVGLDIGAETPEEIAVSVLAELVLVRRGGSARPLRDVERVASRFFPPPEHEGDRP